MRGWQLAILNSVSVRQATIVNWMLLGVYFTCELLYKMKKTRKNKCLACNENQTENIAHFLLYCEYYQPIREEYLPKLVTSNKNISCILNKEEKLILTILDQISSKLPKSIIQGWDSVNSAYSISGKFCADMHKKREKYYNDMDKNAG